MNGSSIGLILMVLFQLPISAMASDQEGLGEWLSTNEPRVVASSSV